MTLPPPLSLHGGGSSNKDSTTYLSDLFTSRGQSVIRFDFSGQGNSSGDLRDSSLLKRYNETRAVLDFFNAHGPLTVIGSSMGGYIATKLLGEYTVEKLILFFPTAYSTRAWSVGFSEGFTEIIRSEKSYLNSNVVEILSGFKGKSLLIMGSEDDIIPDEVVEMYRRGLEKSQFHELTISGCPHPIHRWVKKHVESMNGIIKTISLLIECVS